MPLHQCPGCHQRTVSAWRKLFMLPSGGACRNCGIRLKLSRRRQWLLLVPLLGWAVAAEAVGPGSRWLVLVAAAAAAGYIYIRYVPLEVAPEVATGSDRHG